jgi:hypothetical protein
MNPTPPPHPTPSPQQSPRQTNRGLWVALGITGIGCLGLLLVLGVAGFYLQRLARQDPQPLTGFGEPQMLRQVAGGWMQYRFDDMELTVELPSAPVPQQYEWDAAQRLLVQRWAFYEVATEYGGLDFEALDHRSPIADRLELFREQDLSEIRESSEEPVELQSSAEGTVDGRRALEYEITYPYGEERETGRVLALIVDGGRRVWMIRLYHYLEDREEADRDFARIRGSIRFTAPAATGSPSG